MATILITYDIHPPGGDTYYRLTNAIQSLGEWWHHLETTWIVSCDRQPTEIRDQLRALVGSGDQVLVIDISGDTAEWSGINESGSHWLTENISPPAA